MLQQILDYWYKVELFRPSWPVFERSDIDLLKNPLPWIAKGQVTGKPITYDIYIGCSTADSLVMWLLDKLGKGDPEIERDRSKCCLCAVKDNIIKET